MTSFANIMRRTAKRRRAHRSAEGELHAADRVPPGDTGIAGRGGAEVRRDIETPPPTPWWKRGARWQIAVPLLAVIVALAVAGAWLARDLRAPPNAETSSQRPRGPAIAVLPFTNLSGDAKQDYFSDGLTEDILTELSRARDMRVLARNTTFQYKGKPVDVCKLGRELKARYVLEGSVRAATTASALRLSSSIQRPAAISGRTATIARWPTFSWFRTRS